MSNSGLSPMSHNGRLTASRAIGKSAVCPIIPNYENYLVALEPPRDEPDYWAGAPSVLLDRQGIVWLACRMREAKSPRGERGYEICILKSMDGCMNQLQLNQYKLYNPC